jgi:hypothetical protein
VRLPAIAFYVQRLHTASTQGSIDLEWKFL